MGWIFLLVAVLMEVLGTTALKLSENLTKIVPTLAMFALYALSFGAFTLSLRNINVGVAYAVRAGAGTALIAVVGVVLFLEQMSPLQVVSIALTVVGIIGLNLGST